MGKQNADVLLLGELKGAEAIEEALQVVESGTLVLAEVTALDGECALEQLVDGFEVHRQERIEKRLKRVLNAVVFQQMHIREDGSRYATYEMLEL